MTDVAVSHDRVVDGKWRISEDDMTTTLEVTSNGMASTWTVTPATHPDGYETLAKFGIKALNSIERRKL